MVAQHNWCSLDEDGNRSELALWVRSFYTCCSFLGRVGLWLRHSHELFVSDESLPKIFSSSLPKFLTQFPLPFYQFPVSSCQSKLVSRTDKLWILTFFVTFSNFTSFGLFLANFSIFYYYYSYSRPVPGFWVALWMVPWHKCNSSVSRRGLLALLSIAETRFGEKTLFSPRLSIPLFSPQCLSNAS